jgi:hypothetical protein
VADFGVKQGNLAGIGWKKEHWSPGLAMNRGNKSPGLVMNRGNKSPGLVINRRNKSRQHIQVSANAHILPTGVEHENALKN